MTTRKWRMISPHSRACLLLLLLLGTCRIISADVHAKAVRGEALRRSVLDIYSFDFFASKKGKGMKSNKAGKKDKKKGNKALKKSLKLGKEKGKGRSKNKSKGKGKGKGNGPTPTPSVPSPSPNYIPGTPTRAPSASLPSPPSPPSPITPAPAPSPTVPSLAPTGAPTISGGLSVVTVQLAPYALFYTIEQVRIPFTREADEVVGITAAYLKIFFEEIFFNDPDTVLRDFLTESLNGDSFAFNEPYGIEYSSVAYFSVASSIIPTPGELDNLLSQAFLGQDLSIYLRLLDSLPSQNVFSTTSEVTETKIPESQVAGRNAEPAGSDAKSNDRSSTIPIAAATGAGAFVLIILGVVLYRRRGRYDELDKLDGNDMGHMTVAGETFVGNSTTYSASQALTEQHEEASVGGNRSVAGHSEWAMSTHAVSEAGAMSDQDSLSDDGSTETPPELDEDSVNENDEATIDPGNESEDEEVPVRVVDLIKMFSFSR